MKHLFVGGAAARRSSIVRLWLPLLLAALLVLGTGAGTLAAGKLKIGLALSTLNNPFFVDLRDGAVAAAKAAGATLIVNDAQNDPNTQLSGIEDFIQQKVDVIIINPTDSDAVVPAVLRANQAKIPVITVDRSASRGTVVCHIASDNVAGGRMAGELIAQLLKGKGQVVELEGIPGTSAARDRGQGFHEAIQKYPGIQVVARQPAGFDRAQGMSVMENILQAQPKIDAVFAHNDEMALGAMTAIEAAGRKGIKIVGFDGTDDAIRAVSAGRMVATIAQQPYEMGRLAVEMAVKVVGKQPVPKFVPVPLKLIRK